MFVTIYILDRSRNMRLKKQLEKNAFCNNRQAKTERFDHLQEGSLTDQADSVRVAAKAVLDKEAAISRGQEKGDAIVPDGRRSRRRTARGQRWLAEWFWPRIN